jgi:hypothetical protein
VIHAFVYEVDYVLGAAETLLTTHVTTQM